jgi:hypothetical protein
MIPIHQVSRRKRFITAALATFTVGAFALLSSLLGIVLLGLLQTQGRVSFSMPEFTWASMLLIPLLLAALFFLWQGAILIHETGHWLAGKMTGFRLILFAIGPWVSSWNLGGWKTKWVRNRGYSGMCVMMPQNPQQATMRNYLLYFTGGISANFLAATLGIMTLACLPSLPTPFLLLLCAWILINLIFLLNLYPLNFHGFNSDGGNIAAFLAQDPSASIIAGIFQFQGALMAGMRPSEVPLFPEMTDPNGNIDATPRHHIAILNYTRAIDQNDWNAARHHLDSAESNLPNLPPVLQIPIHYERCFIASRTGDHGRAREAHARIEKHLNQDDDCNACRIKAYYAWHVLESAQDARKWAEQGIIRCPDYPIPGCAKMEQQLLEDLLDRIPPLPDSP